MIEVKPLTEETFLDAEQVVRSRFPESAIAILNKVMRNPMRKVCVEAGDIAYEDGRPVAFQALSGRSMFLGRESFRGNVGGMTVIREGASVEAMIDVRAAACKDRIGNKMGFGNTLCKVTEKMSRRAKDTLGPESCCFWCFRVIRPLDFGWYCFLRKVLKRPVPNWKKFESLTAKSFRCCDGICVVERILSFDPRFDDFWARYVQGNEGLVCSRTAEELNWIFGEEVRDGRAVVLGLSEDEKLNGYIILKDGGGSGRRWQLIDWVALGNDMGRLDALLSAGCRFLRQRTPAMLFESIGFPMFIQDVIRRHLPFRRFAGNNFFSYGYRKPKTLGKKFAEKCETVINTEKSWFFGPYDGDMCM